MRTDTWYLYLQADVETREAERGAAGAACAGAGQLAHPDLCLVVLEAAAQLSNKLVALTAAVNNHRSLGPPGSKDQSVRAEKGVC